MKLVLVGGPAAGKTTLGRLIAKSWNIQFLDTDHWVETHAHKTIATIFATEGESVFRDWETKALKALLEQDNCVISTGGGIVKRAENRALLKETHVVYLNVSIAEQLNRTKGDQTRPLLKGDHKAEILQQLQQERDPLYRNVASLTVDADLSSVELLTILSTELKSSLLRPR